MALVVADRIQETTSNAAGTSGSFTLDGAKAGFQSFAAVGDGNTTYYACTDGTDYEVGIGTYNASGTTLARTTIIESSNSNNAVNWSSGSKDIFVTLPASKAVIEDASNNVTVGNNITVGGTVDGVDIATRDGVLTTTTTTANAAMPKSGGTFTGDVIFDGVTTGRDITFDRSENALTFEDNAQIKLGTGDDLRLYHDGTHNYLLSSSGYTYLDQHENGGVYIRGDHAGNGTYQNMAAFDEDNVVFYIQGNERLRLRQNSPSVDITNGLEIDSGDIDIKTGSLEIGGNVAVPSSFGANGTVLTSNGTSASWQTPSGGSSSLTVQDEGTSLSTSASTLNFVGNGVVASGTGSTKTITVTDTNTTYSNATTSVAGLMSTSDKTKLDGIATSATANPNALDNVVEDTSPQLGGNLDVNGNDIVSTSNGAIELDPDGSGKVVFKGNSTRGAGQFVLNCENNSHGITVKGPPHSAGASYTLTLPDTDGNSSEFLQTDGSGNLSWATGSSYTHPNHSGEVTSTGDGATVIADNVVDEANLKVSNSPTDGYVLTARSGNTGGLTWEAASGGGSGIALTDLSVTQNSASGSGTLTYDNTSGVFSYTPPASSGGGGTSASLSDPIKQTEFTGSATTTFSVTYTSGNINVFLNGSKLAASDFTATNGTSVVLNSACAASDIVTVVEYGAPFASEYSSNIFTVGTSSEYNTSSKVLTTDYTANKVAVYLNGVKLLVGTDCTATNGTTIDLTNSAPVTGDKIEVVEHGSLISPDVLRHQEFTATAGQTVFNVTSIVNAANVVVYFNGSRLLTSEFTVDSTANTVTLQTAAVAGDKIIVDELGTTSVASNVQTLTDLSDTPGSLGTAGQVLQVASNGSSVEFADASSGVTSYANKTAIDNVSNPNEGSLVFDEDKNVLYVRAGSAWERLQHGSNVGPQFTTTPVATLSLNGVTGSTATITAVAADESGFPVTYDWDGISGTTLYSSSSLPNQVTNVSESNGVFTLTPSTNTAHAGSFTFRTKASDGAQVSTATTTVNLTFSYNITTPAGDNVYNYTTGLTGTSGAIFSNTLRTGKYYFEVTIGHTTSVPMTVGLCDSSLSSAGYNTTNTVNLLTNSGTQAPLGTNLQIGGAVNTTSDVLMFAYDTTARKVWLGANGTWYGDPAAGTNGFTVGTSSTSSLKMMFGSQNGGTTSYNGTIIVGSGTLNYSVPSGFSAH